MTNSDKIGKLNIEINQAVKSMKTNEAAGKSYSEEYKAWLSEKMKIRDELLKTL